MLNHQVLEEAVCHRLAQRLNHTDVDAGLIAQTFQSVLDGDADLGTIFRADLGAVYDRDPACTRFLDPLLYFKGFHALVTHRFAHALWKRGRRDFALYLQSQSSRMFGVDIHPAAHFGKGIMLDHATGLVVGETASVGDNCSFLHAVTLGGSGKEKGDRHPKIGDNVLIGAGAKVLGNIKVGECSRIAAGSVVLSDVPLTSPLRAFRPRSSAAPAAPSLPSRWSRAGSTISAASKVHSGVAKLKKEELVRVQAYLRKTFGAQNLEVRPQPKKDDMAEVFINDEFVATLYREVEDGETSYQFQMAILDMDLEGV